MIYHKEAIRNYYVGKGTPGHNRHMLLWDLIDSRWTRMLHLPFMQQDSSSTPHLPTNAILILMVRFWRGFSTCIQRMIHGYDTGNAVNHEIEGYRDGIGVFSFGDAIRDRIDFMPGKLLECFKFSPLFER